MYSIDLKGKKGLVLGVTNQRSIGWGIASKLHEAGATLAFSYQGERLLGTLEKLTADFDDTLLVKCDVTSDTDLDTVFTEIEERYGTLDFVVHSVAFAPPATFAEAFSETSREDWKIAMDVSAYSLVAVAQRAQKLMKNGGSILTMSYLAAERVVPHYNMMGVAKAALEASVRFLAYDLGKQGIRVNAISAGPVRTVAARSIAGFGDMYSRAGAMSMLRRNITQEEVGGLALSLVADDLGGGITGETIYVDAGFHAIGMFLDEAQEAEATGD
ncbi:MAG: enoyl-ACP reductase [Trueperaceae bacterium]|nr:enoyl-ACP reductase [Trueperaceae bacterium]